MQPSRRARIVWGLFACLTCAGLCLAPIPATAAGSWLSGEWLPLAWRQTEWLPAGWLQVLARLFAAMAALAVGWLAAAPILMGRGRYAVRSFCWLPDGTWRLTRPDGAPETARLTSATATLGPWLLLAWQADGRGPVWRRLRYALIDVSDVGIPAFRSLRGRLRLQPVSQSGMAADPGPPS